MEKKIVIGRWEVITILINMICTKIFLNFPRTMEEDAGTAGWMVAIYMSILAFIGFFIIERLYRRFEGKDLIDVGEHLGGGIGRILTGSIILVFLTYVTSVYLRTLAEDMKIVALVVSPIGFVTLFFLLGMIIAAYFGLEAIARFHAITVPIIAAGFLIIMIGVLPYADVSYLLPIFGNGLDSIFIVGAKRVSMYSELLFLFLLIPFLKTHSRFKTSGYAALGFSSFFLILASFIYSVVLPMPVGIERIMPIYHLARLINFGRFFQRIESIFVIIWAAASFLFLSVGLYFILHTFKKTFKLEYTKPLALPIGILVFSISLIPQSLMNAVVLEVKYFRSWSWVVTFGFTILLLFIAGLRKKNKHRKNVA